MFLFFTQSGAWLKLQLFHLSCAVVRAPLRFLLQIVALLPAQAASSYSSTIDLIYNRNEHLQSRAEEANSFLYSCSALHRTR